MKNSNGNDRNNRNQKTSRKYYARKPRHKNHVVLAKHTINKGGGNQTLPAKTHLSSLNKSINKLLPGLKGFSLRKIWELRKQNKKVTEDDTNKNQTTETNLEEKTVNSSIANKSNSGDNYHHSKSSNSNNPNRLTRWANNPRIAGAVAAILLFVMLAAAIIPTSLNVRAEEQAETAALNPTMQLAKEYIYAGSRMLAIEDYGLSGGSTPTPTITPTPTPTETPTPTPTPVLKPDLVISNFTITPASPTEGDQVNFSVIVTNQGAGVMSGFLGVKYQIDGGCPAAGCPSHAVSSTTINPGQSVTLNGASGTWTAVVGAHTLSAQVDDVGAIDESDETNNITTLNVNVNPPPTPTPTPTPPPSVPSIASVTQNADPTCLDITLNGVSAADSYNVKVLSTGYTINVTQLSFPWCGLAPATYYEYQAQAVNQYGTSGWSATVGGTTANPPPTPTPTPTPLPLPSAGNHYQIIAKHSGRCLEVAGGPSAVADTTVLQQWDCNGGSATNQLWSFVQVGDAYQIIAAHSDKCIDVVGGSYNDTAGIQQYTCLGSSQTNQLWKLVQVGDAFQLVAKHSDKCIDVIGGQGATENGVDVQQYTCVGASQTNQLWTLNQTQVIEPTPTPTPEGPCPGYEEIEQNCALYGGYWNTWTCTCELGGKDK